MKKRIIALFVSVLLLTTMAFTGCKAKDDGDAVPLTGEEITVYNWGEYISDGSEGSLDVNEEFTKATGIKVNYQMFQTNEELYTMLKMGSTKIDVMIPSDYMVGKLIEEDLLAELDFDNIPNAQYLNPQFENPKYDPDGKYSLPYTWGTVGIFYNTTMVDPEDVEDLSWNLLWNEKYKGKILMFDNPRDAFAIAQSVLGYSYNTTDTAQLDEAFDLLVKQNDVLQGRVMDQILDKMVNGEAAIGPYYAGDGRIMIEENPDIEFGIPKEGANQFVDAMCIAKSSENKSAAEKYINFMYQTDIALANTEYIGYSTPHTEAKEQLDPEIANNKNYYPSDEVLENTEIFLTLPAETDKYMSDLWIKLKT